MASGDKVRVATYSEVDSIDTRVTTLEDDNDGNAVSVQGVGVSTDTPTDGQVLSYNETSGEYEPSDVASSTEGVNLLSDEGSLYTVSVEEDGSGVNVNDGTHDRVIVSDTSTDLLNSTGSTVLAADETTTVLNNVSGNSALEANSASTTLGYNGNSNITMNSSGTLTAGYTGGSPGTGYIGEVISNSYYGSSTFSSKSLSITLTPGIWILNGNLFCNDASTVSGWAKIGINTSTSVTSYYTTQISTDSENDFGIAAPARYYRLTSNDVLYLNYSAENSRGATWYMTFWAMRVA